MRQLKTIKEAEEKLFDKVAYDRTMATETKEKLSPEALAAIKMLEKKYGKKNLGPYTDFEWGMLCGKFSAIRWVLGNKWDWLDT
jgi:hypothetical protein